MAVAATENSLETISDQLDCLICANRLSDPKDLDCSHTFCCKCLSDYAKSTKANKVISCPLCRQITDLPPGGITSLTTSYLLRDLIDSVPVGNARVPKRKGLRIEKGTRTCGVHNGVARDIYCETCNVLVCHKCLGTGHCSTGHRHFKLATRASYAKQYLKTLSSEIAGKLADLDFMQEEIDRMDEQMGESRKNVLEIIDKHVQEVVSNALQQQTALVSEINGKYLADAEALKRNKQKISKQRKIMKQYYNEIQAAVQKDDAETTVLTEPKLDSRKAAYLGKMEFNLCNTRFEFQKTDVKLGSLKTKSQSIQSTKVPDVKFNWVHRFKIAGSGYKDGIAVSSCGSTMAVCKGPGIQLHKTDNGQLIHSLQFGLLEHLQSPKGVAILNDGSLAVLDASSSFVSVVSQSGKLLDKFSTLEVHEDKSTKVKLSCITFDAEHEVIVVGDSKRKVLTFHPTDGTFLQALHLDGAPESVDLCVAAGLVVVIIGIEVHVVSLTGKKLFVLDKYGDSYWPLAPLSVCFDPCAKFLFISRSVPLGEKSILQYRIPSGRYVGCIYKDLSNPTGMVFFKNNQLAVADGSSVKVLMNAAESQI